MRIKQLGNGGGLNPEMTNSSFLIDISKDNKKSYILFDCGFNIMSALINLEKKELSLENGFKIKDIDYVFISHTDDDHIGNLQTLIYWNYFKNNKVMTLLTWYDSDILKIINEVNQINSLMTGCQMQYKKIIEFYYLTDEFNYLKFKDEVPSCHVCLTPAYHGSKDAYGLIVKNNQKCIFISGDTKAHSNIEEIVSNKTRDCDRILFHDYSYWNAPSKNVHACEGDFSIEYSKEFQEECIKYHTGDVDFNNKWVKI